MLCFYVDYIRLGNYTTVYEACENSESLHIGTLIYFPYVLHLLKHLYKGVLREVTSFQ